MGELMAGHEHKPSHLRIECGKCGEHEPTCVICGESMCGCAEKAHDPVERRSPG